jgi:ABC-type multidrug transport system permease subunit
MIWATIVKEVLLLLRDRGALASMFLLPVVFIAFFGFIFRGMDGGDDENGELPQLALFIEEANPWRERLVKTIEASGIYELKREQSPEAVRKLVAAKSVRAGLIVPSEFNPMMGKKAELSIDEGLSPQALYPTLGSIEGLIGSLLSPAPPGQKMSFLQVRTPPGLRKVKENIDSFQISVPGNAVLFIFFLAMGLAMSFLEERQTGAWRRLLATPVARPLLLFAKLVPYFVVGCLQMTFFFGLGWAAFGMPIGGSLPGMACLTMAVVFAAVGLGLLISSFGGTPKQVAGFASIIVLVLGLAGGCMVPRVIMPASVQNFGLWTPHAWALDGYYDLLIREGTTVTDVLPSILALLAFGAVFSIVGCLVFRFERS